MEAIIVEPKNKEELDAVKKTIKQLGIRSYSISSSRKIYLTKLKKNDSDENREFIDKELIKMDNKEDRKQRARYKLATLSKRNPNATASMDLINKVLKDIRKSDNDEKKK